MSAENIENIFPHLNHENYTIKSAEDSNYNCVAFASGDTTQWWEPMLNVGGYYWPPEASFDARLDSWIQVFRLQGYQVAENGELEAGFEKVAIYSMDADGEMEGRHVARQIVASGKWIRKLGGLEDIEHEKLSCLEGLEYGEVITYLKRPISSIR